MELLIGRENADTNRLSIKRGNKVIENYGAPMSVPQTVSRDQITLTIDEDTGQMTIKNHKNVCCVNGRQIESKVVNINDHVTLGGDGWTLPLQYIADKYAPKFFDLRPLARVWYDYDKSLKDERIRAGRVGALRSGVGIFSIGAILVTQIAGGFNLYSCLFYIVVVVANIVFFVTSFSGAKKKVEQAEYRKQMFMRAYVCPNPKCRHFMGNSPYEIISQNPQCPWCKAKYNPR